MNRESGVSPVKQLTLGQRSLGDYGAEPVDFDEWVRGHLFHPGPHHVDVEPIPDEPIVPDYWELFRIAHLDVPASPEELWPVEDPHPIPTINDTVRHPEHYPDTHSITYDLQKQIQAD